MEPLRAANNLNPIRPDSRYEKKGRISGMQRISGMIPQEAIASVPLYQAPDIRVSRLTAALSTAQKIAVAVPVQPAMPDGSNRVRSEGRAALSTACRKIFRILKGALAHAPMAAQRERAARITGKSFWPDSSSTMDALIPSLYG